MPREIPVRPWQIMATDIFNFNRHNYHVIVDYYPKYPFIRKLREFSSQEVINLTKRIFAELEVSERFISDNGSHFSSQPFKGFAKAWEFENITSSPRYPQSKCVAERCIQTIKAATKKAIQSNRDIIMSLLCLQSTPMDHVIPSRGELLFNRNLVSNFPSKMHQQPCPKRGSLGLPTPETAIAEKAIWSICKWSLWPKHRTTGSSTRPWYEKVDSNSFQTNQLGTTVLHHWNPNRTGSSQKP